jgi:hypothetical protein
VSAQRPHSSSAESTPIPILPPTPVTLSVLLLLLGAVAVGSMRLPRHVWRARPPERGPPLAAL